jgi:hypothetical protein
MTDKEAIEWIENGYFVIANNKLYAVKSTSKMIKHTPQTKFLSEFCEWEERDNPDEHDKLKKRFPNHSVRMIDDTRVHTSVRDIILPMQEDEPKEQKTVASPQPTSVVVVDKLTYNDIEDEKLRICMKQLDGMAQSKGYLSAIKTLETPAGLIKNTERDYTDAIHQLALFLQTKSKG